MQTQDIQFRVGLSPYAKPLAALCASVLLACQAYDPEPLQLESERAAWHARGLLDLGTEELGLRLSQWDAEAPVDEGFDSSDGLTLREALAVGLLCNANLRQTRLEVGAAIIDVENAELWSDPELGVGLARYTEGRQGDPWVVGLDLSFSLPLSERLQAQKGLALAQWSQAELEVWKAEWRLSMEIREAWIVWQSAKERAQVHRALAAKLAPMVETADILARQGEWPKTEANLFGLELAGIAFQAEKWSGQAQAAKEQIRALLGLTPSAVWKPQTEFGLLPSTWPAFLVEPAALTQADLQPFAETHPELLVLESAYQVAEQYLRLQVERQLPDLRIGPSFESDQGFDVWGLTGGLPLPVFHGNRPAIAQARLSRNLVRAKLQAQYETWVGQVGAVKAKIRTLRAQRQMLEEDLLPMAEAQWQAAQSMLSLGEGGGLTVLESLTRSFDVQLEGLEVQRQLAEEWAHLQYLLGPGVAPGLQKRTEMTGTGTHSETTNEARSASADKQ